MLAHIVAAVTCIGAVLGGLLGLAYQVPANRVNHPLYAAIPLVSYASLALGVIGMLILLYLWARQAQAKAIGPSRRLADAVMSVVRTLRRIRLVVIPDDSKATTSAPEQSFALHNIPKEATPAVPTPTQPAGPSARPLRPVEQAIQKREAAKKAAFEQIAHDDAADPPADWTGRFLDGKELIPCAWDDYRTTSNDNLERTPRDAHRSSYASA